MKDIEEMLLDPSKERREEIRKYFDFGYPGLLRLRLGRSILGEDIDLYRIGEGRRNALYVGAHHGTEHITASLLYYFITRILAGGQKIYGMDREVYLKSYSLFVVPMLNPDGVELALQGAYPNALSARQAKMAGNDGFSLWQANARGVDLNHNYSQGFSEYKIIEAERNITPGRTLYSGEYPESEPETRALGNLVRSIDFSLVVSLHSQGEEIYCFPKDTKTQGSDAHTAEMMNAASFEKNKTKSPSSVALRLGERISRDLGYKIADAEGTACYGGFSDYTGIGLEIPSLTLEIGKGKNPLPHSEFYRIKERLARSLALLPTRM